MITKHDGCDEVAIQMRQGSLAVVRSGVHSACSDDILLSQAGVEMHFAHQVMLLAAYEMRTVYLIPIMKVQHAGWTMCECSWAALSATGGNELIYVEKMLQYDGWIKKADPQRALVAYESGHVFLKCFRFTFKQLRVQAKSNTIFCDLSRLQTLLVHAQSSISSSASNVQTFPFHREQDEPYGIWPWSVLSLYDIITHDESTISPIHLESISSLGQMTFTYR